jgi:hypothetical protein
VNTGDINVLWNFHSSPSVATNPFPSKPMNTCWVIGLFGKDFASVTRISLIAFMMNKIF